MALKDLPRSKLEDKALKLGVEFTSKTSDIKLRKRIRVAMKAEKSDKPKAEKSVVWPKEYAPDMIPEYYTTVVGQVMPSNEGKAYKTFLKVLDNRAPTEKVPRMLGKEPDCFGLFFHESLKSCMTHCPHMPLCKRIVETRPELRKIANELDAASAEAEKLTPKQKKEAATAQAKAEAVKAEKFRAKAKPIDKAAKKKLKQSDKASTKKGKRIYVFVGDVDDFRHQIQDRDLLRAYKWMAAQKSSGFSKMKLAKKLRALNFEEVESLAHETIEYLLSKGGLRAKRVEV